MHYSLLTLLVLAVARLAAGQVKCDNTYECPNRMTCCKLASGSWGCCPLPQAVCCQDHIHCCPHGETCDLSKGKCNNGSLTTPWLDKVPAMVQAETDPSSSLLWESERVEADVRCDPSHSCPSGNTCCRTTTGEWGCCPIPKAVCCDDHQHCCPEGYTCHTSAGECVKGSLTLPWLTKRTDLVRTLQKQVEAVRCDATHECPTGNTCCKMSSGQWGCCPLPQAVCCPDHIHCCPNGYTCDTSSGQCNKGPLTLPWLEKRPASMKETPQKQVEAVRCDATHECPTGNTCCKMSSGQWGCCPLPQAVCCPDHIHCCPNGYTCDTSSGQCNKGPLTLPWLEKRPASMKETPQKQVEAVRCDATHECPTGNTCCKMSSGQWGCCPLPQAVCCPDHIHCCPNGYTCDTSSGQCNKGPLTFPWLEKRPASVKEIPQKQVEAVRCDATHECPTGNTCCKMSSGQWGCCPLPQAVCCPDHIHCCPNGYTCDTSSGQCNKGPLTLPWLEKRPASMKEIPQKQVEAVRCDATHECPTGNTCCKMSSGQWGCCPLPQAVCCPDHIHCCPNGYTCVTSSGQCNKGSFTLPWLEKRPAAMREIPQPQVKAVRCDATHECPTGSTCCKLASGQWGCCPMPQAVCCSDHIHCCPNGYKCNTSTGQCQKGSLTLPWLQKISSVFR